VGHAVADVENWWGEFEYEAVDKNGNPIKLTMDGYEFVNDRFDLPPAGTKVRVRLMACDHWLESDWSDWYTFEGRKLDAPTLSEYDRDSCKISWSEVDGENVSHYVYTINGGESVKVELTGNRSVILNNGDVLRVRCVASEEGAARGYVDSDWVEYTCVDNRTPLAVPSNVRMDTHFLVWDAVEGASYYVVEVTWQDGRVTERQVGKCSMGAYGEMASFRVRAVTGDTENKKSSNWSESVINTSEKG